MTTEESAAVDAALDLAAYELNAADIADAERALAGKEPVPAPEGEGPHPFMSGTFALYATAKGDVVLATHTDLTGDRTVKVPRMVVAQAKRGNPLLAELLDHAKKSA